jgi:DNA mismatch repair protein MutS
MAKIAGSCIIKYFDLQEEYELKYGNPTIVLMQIGDFYEMHEYDPNSCEEEYHMFSRHRPNQRYDHSIGHIQDIALILNDMAITMPNKNKPYCVDNPYKAGFPVHSYEPKQRMLLERGYVIVKVDQVEKSLIHNYRSEEIFYVTSGSEPRRVSEIISRATSIDADPPMTGTNNIVSIYIEYQKGVTSFDDLVVTCGISCIDVTTGINRVCEIHSKEGNKGSAIQEIIRFLLAQQPREILVNVHNLPKQFKRPDDRRSEGKTKDEGADSGESYAQFLTDRLELHRCVNHVIHINKVDPEYLKLAYQAQFFNKVFFIPDESNPAKVEETVNEKQGFKFGRPKVNFRLPPGANNMVDKSSVQDHLKEEKSMSTLQLLHSNSMVLNKLGLEQMSYGRISYILLLQYCYEHSPYLISRVQQPDTGWIDSLKHLTLTHNAIKQLNISPEHGFNYRRSGGHSLFEVLNFTSTRMGYRMLRNRLFNPLIDSNELNQSYQMIEEMEEDIVTKLSIPLKGMPDIDHLYRKLAIQVIKPKELVTLYNAYSQVAVIYGIILSSDKPSLQTVLFDKVEEFNMFLSEVFNTFDLVRLQECKIVGDGTKAGTKVMDFTHVPIKIGAAPKLDELVSKVLTYEEELQSICDHLNSFISGKRGAPITYHLKVKDIKKREERIVGVDIQTTQAKARVLAGSSTDPDICGELSFETVHSRRRITSSVIKELINSLNSCKQKLRVGILRLYRKFIARVRDWTFYEPVSEMISVIDFTKSARQACTKYHYFRPIIVDSITTDAKDHTIKGNSFLDIQDLRHPVIERIIDQPYITNDLQLGTIENYGDPIDIEPENVSKKSPGGLLVYGANSTGKSSLARATGLAIIMAQAGMYTACHLRYRPFHRIFTRISGNDDIMKGMSSFVVEMYEMRIFDREADSRSLILGDEPCRGTERYSGAGIALTAIERLIQRNSCFIFATHMHDMLKLKAFESIRENIQVAHLNMYYDQELDRLVINRKLTPGSGPTIYGIEVAKSLGFESEFIRRAMEIRAETSDMSVEILPPTKSRYNSTVYRDRCSICGSQTDLHTHHLAPQKQADEAGFIGSMPKDISGNLVTLCETCHHRTHKENLNIKKVETVEGVAVYLTNSP